MKRTTFLFALAIGCGSSAVSVSEEAIAGGSPSAPGQFPGVGALYYEGTFEGREVSQVACSGTLIAPDVVLTAAHCLEPNIVAMVGLPTFSVADDATQPGTVWVEAERAVVHELYDATVPFHVYLETPNDVALIFLSEPITGVELARIATRADDAEIEVGLAVEIVGYGQTVPAVREDVTTVGIESFTPSVVTEVGATEVRLGEIGAPGICFHDSGGPTFATLRGERRLIGVTSHKGSEMLIPCDQGSVDERIGLYADWIVEHAPQVCTVTPDACPDVPDAGTIADAGTVTPPMTSSGCAITHARADHARALALLTAVLALITWSRRR